MKPCTEKVFQNIYQQGVEISGIFELILSLFGGSGNIDLINRTTPTVFLHFHNALYDAVILKLAKITDPAKIGGFQNLSIDHLIQLLKDEDSPIISQLEHSKMKINSFLPELRKIRNKRIAHNDLQTHLRDLHKVIKNGNIDGALNELQNFFNIISSHYQGAESQLKPIYPTGDGPELFLDYLRAGLDAYWNRDADELIPEAIQVQAEELSKQLEGINQSTRTSNEATHEKKRLQTKALTPFKLIGSITLLATAVLIILVVMTLTKT